MIKYFYLLVLACTLLPSCSSNTNNEGNFEKGEANNQVEVTPQTLELTDLEGNKLNLNGLKGEAVFLNLWATWCRPCLMEMPSIEKAYQKFKDNGYVFLLASNEAPEKIRAFAQEQDYTFPFAHLKSDIQALGVQSIPTTFIYNESGEVVARITGTRAWDSPKVIAKLESWKTAEPLSE